MSVLKIFDGTQYIPVGGGSGGLASTGGYYAVWSADPLLSNEKIITAGSSVTLHTDASAIYINATTNAGGGSTEIDMFSYAHIGSFPGASFGFNMIPGKLVGDDLSTASFAADTMFFVPFIVTARSLLVDRVSIFTTVTGAGALLRVGIYSNSGPNTLYPFEAIQTSGILATVSGGLTNASLKQTLSSNTLYWFCYQAGTAASTIGRVANSIAYNLFGIVDTGGLVAKNAIIVGQVFSNGLPASVQTGGVLGANSPAFYVRRSL